MEISAASETDVEGASECLASAFEADPLMKFFFPGPAANRQTLVVEMFALLLSVRIALGMPVLLIRRRGKIVGAVMGYDTRNVEWPHTHRDQWTRLERKHVAMADRFEQLKGASKRFRPLAPHYYIGALGVEPPMQGRGVGASLLDAYCEISAQEATSTGTYLETSNPRNLGFYQGCGFNLLGQSELDSHTSLWSLFRPRQSA